VKEKIQISLETKAKALRLQNGWHDLFSGKLSFYSNLPLRKVPKKS
jgi:hypothetical protein